MKNIFLKLSFLLLGMSVAITAMSHGTPEEHNTREHMKLYHKYGTHSDRLRYNWEREQLKEGNFDSYDYRKRTRDHRRHRYYDNPYRPYRREYPRGDQVDIHIYRNL